MKEYPILFSAPMVKAILGGQKTQTRRVMKVQPECPGVLLNSAGGDLLYLWPHKEVEYYCKCPYGVPGDRLWVRETWRAEELDSGLDGVRYAADNHFRPIENTPEAAEAWGNAHFSKHGKPYNPLAWRPSIFMPRWASRLTLVIVSVEVQRLQDITVGDVLAEGISDHVLMPDDLETGSPLFHQLAQRQIFDKFVFLWDTINAARDFPFAFNPWIWRIEFKSL